MELCISNQEKNFIIDGVQDNIRNDGRGNTDYRPIYVETGVLPSANGSARVQLGSTVLLVAVKAEMTTVEDSSKSVNRLRFFIDCSAIASPVFVGKGGNDYGENVAKLLYNAYNNDSVIPNIDKLILSKTFMWTIFVDIVVLQYGGSVVDAASIGTKAALTDTKICQMIVRPADEGKIILDLPDECNTWSLDVARAPLVVGINKIGDQSAIDANEYEEACASSILFVAVQPPETTESLGSHLEHDVDDKNPNNDDYRVVCVRKNKGGCLDLESVEDMINIGVGIVKPLNRALLFRLHKEQLLSRKVVNDNI